jgi:uncharacterized glyoxalase superfamily protein PhnB
MELTPYLNFNGTCAEAFRFYEQLLGGKIVAPVGQSIVTLNKMSPTEFKKQEFFGFSFVPLVED